MPLHDHPNIVVLSRVLYRELEELNVDGDFDRMDVDSDAVVNDNDRDNGDASGAVRVLQKDQGILLNHAFSFHADGGKRRAALPPVLRVRPNRNPMGATRIGGRGGEARRSSYRRRT